MIAGRPSRGPEPTQAELAHRREECRRIWAEDPVAFGEEALGVHFWSKQREILTKARRKAARVAVRSGHKCGKSLGLITVALWFFITKPEAQVVLTAPTARQVREVLWRELKLRVQKSRLPLGGKLNEQPATGYRFQDGRQIVGLSAKDAEKIAGFSGKNVLFVIDEASGVPEKIFEAIEGNRAGGATLLMASNPTQVSGEFHAAFHRKSHLYSTVHMSSRDVPNVTGIGPSIAGLATPEWIREKDKEWGRDSPLYQVRIEGNFPVTGDGRVISLSLVDLAHIHYDHTPAEGPLDIGVDVARDGADESVIVARRGRKVLSIEAFHGLHGPQLAKRVLATIRKLRRPGEATPARVKIDSIGVGASPYDALETYAQGEKTDVRLVVIAVCASSRSDNPGEYANMKAQLQYGVREWLLDGGVLPEDEKLDQELIEPRTLFNARGQILVSEKDAVKAEIGRSPDRADALALCVYDGGSPAEDEAGEGERDPLRDLRARDIGESRGNSRGSTSRGQELDLGDIDAEELYGFST